jgi:hypothetical protein
MIYNFQYLVQCYKFGQVLNCFWSLLSGVPKPPSPIRVVIKDTPLNLFLINCLIIEPDYWGNKSSAQTTLRKYIDQYETEKFKVVIIAGTDNSMTG